MSKAKMINKGKLTILAALFSLCFSSVAFSSQMLDVVVMAIFGDVVILKVDGEKHKLKVGEQTSEGITLLEADSDTVVLKINNKKSTHKLGSHASFGNAGSDKPKGKKNPIAKIWPRNDMYITQGSINNFSVQFMVDTGATWIAMSEAMAKRLGIDYYRGKKGMAGTANGASPYYEVNLDRVKVGDIELLNVSAAVMSGYRSHQVLLGNSFLKRCELTRTKRVMILKKKF